MHNINKNSLRANGSQYQGGANLGLGLGDLPIGATSL